jgi:hypothetical protein
MLISIAPAQILLLYYSKVLFLHYSTFVDSIRVILIFSGV